MYRTARRLLGTHEEAEDLSQETFIKAYHGLGSFHGDSSFSTWIYRITVNLSLNALRKRKLGQLLRLTAWVSASAAGRPGQTNRWKERKQ